MLSSTSSSEPIAPITPPERPLPAMRLELAGIVAVLVALSGLAAWEIYWRDYGSVPSYRNSEGLWAMQRSRIDNGEGDATVLVGSSRTLSNIRLDVWERVDGTRPIQLALEGTSPLTPLEGLADDPDFTGRVIVGVSPGLFFSGFAYRGDVFEYYAKETPAQRVGQRLSMATVEPLLAFYDPDFALFTILERQPWPSRAGVPVYREVRKLFVSEADRNMRMWTKVERDVAYQDTAKEIWAQNFKPPNPEMIARFSALRQTQLDRAAAAVEKLKKRGVEVIFVLHPTDGAFREFEAKTNPRLETWDVLLERAGVRGIHFEDYPELQRLNLPEWSHLASADAKRYTEALARIVQREQRLAIGGED